MPFSVIVVSEVVDYQIREAQTVHLEGGLLQIMAEHLRDTPHHGILLRVICFKLGADIKAARIIQIMVVCHIREQQRLQRGGCQHRFL